MAGTTGRPRGRPRKKPTSPPPQPHEGPKRPRGRPRKKPIAPFPLPPWQQQKKDEELFVYNKDEDDSDVELTGVDLEDDDNEEEEEEEDSKMAAVPPAAAAAASKVDDDNDDEVLQSADAQVLQEAHRERQELLAAERKKIASLEQPADPGGRFDYLLAQSDVFAHFLAGSVAANDARKKRGGKAAAAGGRSGKMGRMTEAEEDEQLLKRSKSKRQGVVRLDAQPQLLASHCKMHPYQLEGLNWLIKLHDHSINGVLADEMGLGKTLQTISLLAYLREARGIRGPHLVLVPKSVVGNWIREFQKWCPSIRAVKMGGTKDERVEFMLTKMPVDPQTGRRSWDVLVTSYEGLLKEKGRLGRMIDWSYLIIDEAHRIKNENSSLSQAVRTIPTQHRLLITGTPLQNNLRELWALLNFLMPDIFGNADQFDAWFSMNDQSGQENVIRKLHTVLRPFMLRRVKRDVATALPPKKETKLYIGLTQLQQEWYVKCLQKDAHELNKLGGPDRNRLLNVLMQLRKVCNHPYLFDGAEAGPPYTDGPHLWETSGKMSLLHKLLFKLQARGSRVLIFCQMTRVLDILEDYCNLVGFNYCRIDGNTEGSKRDSQMDEFNAPHSSKFCFLLSTRAGGLGINLATADIVILYDSDWNPQVDLQAMDRAHRIGQTKPVQVFRFITEGTVEEKIIERADRKLFLDAAVIQQGRLAEQHNSLEKNELMKMVRFGADQILAASSGSYTDQDIDALIAKGEERTEAMQAKLQKDAKHNLANFSLLAADDNDNDTFNFGGKNYRGDRKKNAGNFINLQKRARKRNYDLNALTKASARGVDAAVVDAPTKKRRKGPALHDFQLFDLAQLNIILTKERNLASQKEQQLKTIADIRQIAAQAPQLGAEEGQSQSELLQRAQEMEAVLETDFHLTAQEEATKKELLSQGFPDWSRKDFKSFTNALERHGRYEFTTIAQEVARETSKPLNEIRRYFVAFWMQYRRIAEWEKMLERIEKGEKKILRLRQIRDAIQEKIERHLEDTYGDFFNQENVKEIPSVARLLDYSWPHMKINYGPGSTIRGKGYQEEEDAFLVHMMYRHGYGANERIRMEIRRAWQFRFDWYFKSRSGPEIQKRCDLIVKVIERENEEVRKKEAQEREKGQEHAPVAGLSSIQEGGQEEDVAPAVPVASKQEAPSVPSSAAPAAPVASSAATAQAAAPVAVPLNKQAAAPVSLPSASVACPLAAAPATAVAGPLVAAKPEQQ